MLSQLRMGVLLGMIAVTAVAGCQYGGSGEVGVQAGPGGIEGRAKWICNPPPGAESKVPQVPYREVTNFCGPLRVYTGGPIEGPPPGSDGAFELAALSADWGVSIAVVDLDPDVAARAMERYYVDEDGNPTAHLEVDVDVDGVRGLSRVDDRIQFDAYYKVDWEAFLGAPMTVTICVPAGMISDEYADDPGFLGVEVSGAAGKVLADLFERGPLEAMHIPLTLDDYRGDPVTGLVLRHDPDLRILSAFLTHLGASGELGEELVVQLPTERVFRAPAAAGVQAHAPAL